MSGKLQKDCRIIVSASVELTHLGILRFILIQQRCFPNLKVGLQIMLSIAVSVAGWKRSFSKLKLIFMMRSIMTEERLMNLQFLSIEQETDDLIDFSNVTGTFSSISTSRKVLIYGNRHFVIRTGTYFVIQDNIGLVKWYFYFALLQAHTMLCQLSQNFRNSAVLAAALWQQSVSTSVIRQVNFVFLK